METKILIFFGTHMEITQSVECWRKKFIQHFYGMTRYGYALAGKQFSTSKSIKHHSMEVMVSANGSHLHTLTHTQSGLEIMQLRVCMRKTRL